MATRRIVKNILVEMNDATYQDLIFQSLTQRLPNSYPRLAHIISQAREMAGSRFSRMAMMQAAVNGVLTN